MSFQHTRRMVEESGPLFVGVNSPGQGQQDCAERRSVSLPDRAGGLRWLVLFLAVCASMAYAHGPFDNSAKMIVFEDHLEIGVTMGADAAGQCLSHAGFSRAKTVEALQARGSGMKRPLPNQIAARFFKVSADDNAVEAQDAGMISDGLEATFVLTYPRPAAELIEIEALYFTGVEAIKHAPLRVTDEIGNRMGSALFSRTNTVTRVRLAPVKSGSHLDPVPRPPAPTVPVGGSSWEEGETRIAPPRSSADQEGPGL